MLAWVCEKVGGAPVAELISQEIWSKLGMESDGCFTVDREGTALADGGFNATLRDFGRFGQMHLEGGQFRGAQILSQQQVQACRTGDSDKYKILYKAFSEHYPKAAYANKWWVVDSDREVYSARGVFGQMICIVPHADLVVVKLSSWPTFLDFDRGVNTYRLGIYV